MARGSLLKRRWKKEMEEADGQVEAPLQTSSVPFATENRLALHDNESGLEIARAYVTKVMETCMARNDTLTCKRFLRLITDLRDRGVDTDEATTCITELFQGTYSNLIMGFNELMQRVDQDEGDPQAITMPEDDPLDRQLAITMPEEDRDKRKQAITLPEEDLDKRPFKEPNDIVQDFEALQLDTSIIPSTGVMLAVQPGQEQARPRKLTSRVGVKQHCSIKEGERKVPGESSRLGESARPADKARKDKEKLNTENPKENNMMRKRKGRNWEEGSLTKADNHRYKEHKSKRVLERNAKRRQSSSYNGSIEIGFPNLDRMPKGIANMRQSLSDDGGKVAGSAQLQRVPERIANKRLSSTDGSKDDELSHLNRVAKDIGLSKNGRAAGSPQLKRAPSERIANRKLSPDGGRHSQWVSTRSKRQMQVSKDQNIKGKVGKSLTPPSLQLPTTAELVERLNKCRPWRDEPIVEYNWYSDEE